MNFWKVTDAIAIYLIDDAPQDRAIRVLIARQDHESCMFRVSVDEADKLADALKDATSAARKDRARKGETVTHDLDR